METSESFTPEPVDEDAGATGEVPSDEGEGKERQKETPPLDDSGSGPRWRSGSFDGARLQLVELLVIARAHLLEEPERRLRLILVDPRKREANVHENPVVGSGWRFLAIEEPDVDRPP